MAASPEINFPGWVGGWVGGWSELELRLSSGQQKLELGLGLSLAKRVPVAPNVCVNN